jgi:transcriptional regulator with XRE-family HTH domain
MTKAQILANKLANLAKLRGTSQARLARSLEMQPSHLNHFLKGHGDVRSASLVNILSELGIDLEAIVDKELAKVRGEELVDLMGSGELLESLVASMQNEDRHAFIGYTMKFAIESLGVEAKSKVRRLRTLL